MSIHNLQTINTLRRGVHSAWVLTGGERKAAALLQGPGIAHARRPAFFLWVHRHQPKCGVKSVKAEKKEEDEVELHDLSPKGDANVSPPSIRTETIRPSATGSLQKLSDRYPDRIRSRSSGPSTAQIVSIDVLPSIHSLTAFGSPSHSAVRG